MALNEVTHFMLRPDDELNPLKTCLVGYIKMNEINLIIGIKFIWRFVWGEYGCFNEVNFIIRQADNE